MSEKRFDPNNKNSLDFMTEREYARFSHYWSLEQNQAIADQAVADPTFDYFDALPAHVFDRPKYQIGRYALKNGVSVPLLRTQAEWERTFQSGRAFLRSERHEDYTGPSGIDKSIFLSPSYLYPSTAAVPPELLERNYEGYSLSRGRWTNIVGPERQLIHGPALVDDPGINFSLQQTLMNGLKNGQVGFNEYAALQHRDIYGQPIHRRPGLTFSPWRYLDGINLSIMRDPVVEGRYYVGHTGTHHYVWRVDDGSNSADLMAMRDSSLHFKAQHNLLSPEDYAWYHEPIDYVLPTAALIDIYEAVRTLPYFDQRQAPVMEMQYDQGKYHFLQYLKTGRQLGDPGEFKLPAGPGIVRNTSVLGATSPEGERIRIYLDSTPGGETPAEGYYVTHNLAYKQRVAMGARAIIWDHFLGMKTNHYDGSFLTRPPLVFALWGGGGELEAAINKVSGEVSQIHRDSQQQGRRPAYYIEATLTSNGREGTVESDWQIRPHDA